MQMTPANSIWAPEDEVLYVGHSHPSSFPGAEKEWKRKERERKKTGLVIGADLFIRLPFLAVVRVE